jgi:hypothetical protein
VTGAEGILAGRFPKQLVDELLACYVDQKRNLALGHLRPTEVEGGRFAEAAFRLLEHIVGGAHTPLGKRVDTDKLILRLQNLPSGQHPDSVRLHIPRTLRVVYDIRNNRDAAHLADGIDPNLQDSYLVSGCVDWVLAEFLRLAGAPSPDEAQRLIEGITVKRTPAVEEFGPAQLKTLRPSLGTSERILLLLYSRGQAGATAEELASWLKPQQRTNLGRALRTLEHDKDFLVLTGGKWRLTQLGIREVERKGLADLT